MRYILTAYGTDCRRFPTDPLHFQTADEAAAFGSRLLALNEGIACVTVWQVDPAAFGAGQYIPLQEVKR